MSDVHEYGLSINHGARLSSALTDASLALALFALWPTHSPETWCSEPQSQFDGIAVVCICEHVLASQH